MAIICLLSAKGSPGVTTTTIGLTLAWSGALPGRTALAVDADPIGGDFAAGVLRGCVPPGSGMLPLATTRGQKAAAAVDAAAVALRDDATARVLVGVPDSARAAGLGLAWDVVATAGAQDAPDVLVDCGRVDAAAPLPPWLTGSDLALLVARPTLTSVTAARRLVDSLTAPAANGAAMLPASRLGLIVLDAASPYRPSEVAEVIGLPLMAWMPFEPAPARVHSEGAVPPRGFARSGYVRSLQGLAAAIGDRLGAAATGSSRATHVPATDVGQSHAGPARSTRIGGRR